VELRLGVLAGALIVAAIAAAPAHAAPVTPDAKAAFADGVARYQKADWDGAAAAFAKSYNLEADSESLFAWAQAERKLGHCDKALELYDKLLAQASLPEANATAVRKNRDECQVIVARDRPAKPDAPSPPDPLPQPPPHTSVIHPRHRRHRHHRRGARGGTIPSATRRSSPASSASAPARRSSSSVTPRPPRRRARRRTARIAATKRARPATATSESSRRSVARSSSVRASRGSPRIAHM